MKFSDNIEKEIKIIMVNTIRGELEGMKFPDEIVLDFGAVIIDPKKFFESHLTIVEHNTGYIKNIFGERLTNALNVIGIDAHKIRKQAEKFVLKKYGINGK